MVKKSCIKSQSVAVDMLYICVTHLSLSIAITTMGHALRITQFFGLFWPPYPSDCKMIPLLLNSMTSQLLLLTAIRQPPLPLGCGRTKCMTPKHYCKYFRPRSSHGNKLCNRYELERKYWSQTLFLLISQKPCLSKSKTIFVAISPNWSSAFSIFFLQSTFKRKSYFSS